MIGAFRTRADRSVSAAVLMRDAIRLSRRWQTYAIRVAFSAALFAFLASFGEFLTSLFVIGSTRSTLPIQLWKGIRFETNPTIAAAASMLVAISLLALLAVELARWQTRRRSEVRPAAQP